MRYILLGLFITTFFAIVYAYTIRKQLSIAVNVAKDYQAQNLNLKKQLEKVYNDKMETDKRNANLEKAEKLDKSGFDWYFDISNSSVVDELRKD